MDKDKPLNFIATLDGDAKKIIQEYKQCYDTKAGRNTLMGKNRITQILLCELYKIKKAAQLSQGEGEEPLDC